MANRIAFVNNKHRECPASASPVGARAKRDIVREILLDAGVQQGKYQIGEFAFLL
jgi:hypothetical protein